MRLFLSLLMAITSNSLKTSSFHILFILCMFLFSIPLLLCNLERTQEGNVSISNPLGLDGCLYEGQAITNDTNTILVSIRKVFEFGFFTPDKKAKNSRYLGIWYYNQSNPKIVVWVANRDEPLLGSSGSLVIEHGKAKVLDGKGVVYWSTNVPSGQVQTKGPAHSAPTFNGSNVTPPNELHRYERFNFSTPPPDQGAINFSTPPPHHGAINKTRKPTRNSARLCLYDNGNLKLEDNTRPNSPVLWQSFDQPTDTFLPDMSVDESSTQTSSIKLTCWLNHNNPAKGNFTFLLQPGTSNEWVIKSGQSDYWQSKANPFDKVASTLNQSGNGIPLLQKGTRLVMNFTGQIQFWKRESERGWSLNWSEPKDKCSVKNICGDFGSCNSYNGASCKCLPGFNASAKSDASRGCSPISGPPNERDDSLSDTFIPLPMMAVGNETCAVSTEDNCSDACLKDYHCVAYSQDSDCSGASSSTEKRCLRWNNLLTNLQEESPDGITIFVRTTYSDIEPFSKVCRPCGAYTIPYPLSTGRNCGDPSYFNFHCINKTGQVNFSTPKGNFRVSSINPDTKSFNIQVMHRTCDRRYIDLSVLSDKDSFPFTFRNCVVVDDRNFNQQLYIEVEIVWKPPPPPLCSASSDCNHWSHTTCKLTNEGKMRCICGSKFHWDGMKLECTRVPFPPNVVILCIAGALTVFLVPLIFLVYHIRKRRLAKGQGLFEFKGDDIEGIDVPFFDWESILAATNNFADANRLGIGGFGSVYLGKLPDGEEVAVKRLSSVSVQGVQEFRTEVMLIAKLQHRNLVKLLGYCTKADEKILVYEFMPNGSLDSSLFDEKHSVYLDWKKRFDIIVGIARGLLYLHQDSRLRIIHRDLKPSNILLDEELNPKISDFGIARIVGGKDTQASTGRVVGTYGYMSPEYAYEGIFSVKFDVFSFGVVILETISGRRNSRIFMFEHGLSLLGYAWNLWNEDKGLELMDPKLNESCLPSEVQKCIHIGLLCVQEDPSDRPTMSTVVYMLSGENTSLPLAKQPAFMNRKPLSDNASSSSAKDLSAHEVMTVSTVGR